MLRIAVPNKGSLSEMSAQMLKEAGYNGRRETRQLVALDEINQVKFFYLRPRDIATYVASGAVDVGITGRDLLLDSGSEATEISDLEFAGSTFRFAAVEGEIEDIADLAGKRVATSYPKLVDDFLLERGIRAELIKLDGAVESAVELGVADAVADVVSTGETLRRAGLKIFGPVILESSAVLIEGPTTHPHLETLLSRLEGVSVARKYVIMDYDLPADKLQEATTIAPGIESPTVQQLVGKDWVAVRVMVLASESYLVMDKLHDIGAKAIMVTAIHAARI